ncbi:hypothetical protein ABB37_04025 [Leptomonas pyrrhocoris]|uniref:Uncharacterized protein n=1 Tax=Leptomonas pyrrhocoris TaxID=157538 RepID=A0A0N0VFW9_LEPPY|nr:hypothetical protein ABB37_04025 [Leptomonas pyrrhocoris]KPA81732.1 hypothetical protein ABB37_04025 [Leptomonas pyrrhocoris]|eukprot:XP_015660171.1 hypothetical protein ABB37_04025 [Leptomonas pyrrhocoris]
MLVGKSVTRATAATSGSGSHVVNDNHEKTSTLTLLTELFNARELSPPLSAVALQPERLLRNSNEEAFIVAEEEDYVIHTLRSAPLSLFRESASNSGSSGLPFPELLEVRFNSNVKVHSSAEGKSKSRKSTASESASRSTTATSSSTASDEALASLTKVLSMLSLVFQRSPAALGKSGNYAKLLCLLKESDFVTYAARNMEELWRRCAGQSVATSNDAKCAAFPALALFCDVLVLLACHSGVAPKDAASAGKSTGRDSSIEASAVPSSSSSAPSASAFAAPTSLSKLYALNQEMGAALTDAVAPPAFLRRSVASLTAFLIHCAPHLPEEAVESALRDLENGGAVTRANVAHMAFVAALPSACPTMSPEWQCRALDVVRQATLYDADVQVAYCADGPTSVVLGVVMAKFGSAVHGLLSIMSAVAWCYCTADALVHMCRAVGVYGGTWETYPASYVNLVNFLHRALLRYPAAHEKTRSSCPEPRGSSGNTEGSTGMAAEPMTVSGASTALAQAPRRSMSTAGQRIYRPSIESLVDGAISSVAQQGEEHAASASNRQGRADSGQWLATVPSFADDVEVQGEDNSSERKEEPTAYLLRCEADPRSPRNFLFYLSLLAYVTSALPPLLNSFEELPLFFALSNCTRTITDVEEEPERGVAASAAPLTNANASLFSLCVDLLRANLSLAVGVSYDHTSRTERQRRLFCEATVSLLSAFMCEFPHSIQRLEVQTGCRNLVHTVSYVVTTIMHGSTASFQMKRTAYALLYRYGSAVESLRVVLARLVSPTNWTTLCGDAEYAQADLSESVELYKYLCNCNEDIGAAEMGHALVAAAEMPAGAFRCVVGGAAVATVVVNAVFDLREVATSESALFAAVTVPQLPQLFSRLGEALDTLLQAHRDGCWMAGGRSTWKSANVAAWLLYKTASLYRAPAMLPAATFPVPFSSEEADPAVVAGRRPRSAVAVCFTVLCDTAFQPAHREMAELLVAAMQACAEQQNAQQAFQALRSTLPNADVAKFRAALLTVQKGDNVGSVSNSLRLEVWLAMVRWCPALFVLLFGPPKQTDGDEEDQTEGGSGKDKDSPNGETASDNDAATAADAQPENLPFAKLLAATIRTKDTPLHEKALALQVLRYTGLSNMLDVDEVAALLLKEGGAKKSRRDADSTTTASAATAAAATSSPCGGVWEVTMLAVACITYINASIAGQLAKAKKAAESGGAHSSDNGNEGAGAFTTADARAPLRRPNVLPLSPPIPPITTLSGASPAVAVRCKVLANYTDTIDQLLRHARVIMDECRTAYERESREVDYEDVFEWLARHDDNRSDYGEGLSASVVLPRRSGLLHGAATRVESTFGAESTALVRHTTSTALTTAASRVSSLHTSKAAFPLFSLSTGQLASLLPYHRLVPVGPAESRFFRGTGDDHRLNALATLLDSAADVAAAVEQLLWFSVVDTNVAGLFSKRTLSLFEASLNSVVACRANSPLLAPLLTRYLKHALRLARAATGVLEGTLGSDMMELEVAPSIQRAMLQLAAFVKVNHKHRFLFVDAVPIVTAFPLNSLPEQAAVEELMRDVQAMLHDQLVAPIEKDREEEAFHVFDTAVEGCTRYFGRQRSDSSSVDTVLVARLLSTLLQYASLLSRFIQPTQPACAKAYRFAGVLECVCCILASAGKRVAVLGFISEDTLLGFTRALGQFALSAVYDHAAQCHRRLGLHVCWYAVVSLWCVVVSLRGPFDARASGWLPSLKSALESIPRFASAVGAFPGAHGADRQALLVWELEEVDVATRLAAALALQDVLLPSLLTSVQAGFLFLQQPRLQQRCVASLPTPDASTSEGHRIVAAQAHALRNALVVLLKQPYYALPRDGVSHAAFVFSPELLRDPALISIRGGATAERGGVTAQSLIFSLDLLRQFTVRELQLLRRITASAATTGGLERSPDVSRISTGSVPSRESSVGRSPSRGPLGDGETVTDVDELYTADGAAEDVAEQHTIHLETVQLALNAYVLSVDDLLDNASYAPGGFYTSAVTQTIRHATERLLHTLRSLAREVRDLRRPLLSQIVQAKTAQLQAVLERL